MTIRTYRSTALPNFTTGVVNIFFEPNSGYQWMLQHVSVFLHTIPGSPSGQTSGTANLFVDNAFICTTSTGKNDSADGTPIPVYDGSQVKIQWNSIAGNIAFCEAVIIVDETVRGQPR